MRWGAGVAAAVGLSIVAAVSVAAGPTDQWYEWPSLEQPVPEPEEVEVEIDDGAAWSLVGLATHYGEWFNGRSVGCAGFGVYSSGNRGIVAVGYSQNYAIPCGTRLRISGPRGFIDATRVDTCGGCDAHGILVDLSEAGHEAVCGKGTCTVTVEVKN